MKSKVETFNGKIEILGMTQDNNVEKCDLNWYHIRNNKQIGDFYVKFNVQGYPTKILLGRNGKILLRSVGEVESFYHDVEKLISQ